MPKYKSVGPSQLTVESPLHKTPFEKSLTRRLFRVDEIRTLVSLLSPYTFEVKTESPDVLLDYLKQYNRLDAELGETVSRYLEISLARKALFKGSPGSLKEIAYAIKVQVTKDKSLESPHVENVRKCYAAIFAQNPLAPPIDFARAHYERDLDAFTTSYQVISENFEALVGLCFQHHLLPPDFTPGYAQITELLGSVRAYKTQIAALIQKMFVLYEERMILFNQIKDICNAICNRARHLVGSHDAVYKQLFALKHAIM